IVASAFVMAGGLSGAAPRPALLIAARLLQAGACGMLTPHNSGLIQDLGLRPPPDARHRSRPSGGRIRRAAGILRAQDAGRGRRCDGVGAATVATPGAVTPNPVPNEHVLHR